MKDRLRRGLYFAADTGLLEDAQICEVTRGALEGGVVLVQLRAKDRPAAEVAEIGRRLTGVCEEFDVPLLVNDLPAVALKAGAGGVHVGQGDEPVTRAREILGPDAIIGVTTPTPGAVRNAEACGADYVSAGPMFRSPTKPDKPVAGPQLAKKLRTQTSLPLCAIGGITADRMHELSGCGLDLVCVISAIATAADPKAATEELVTAMREAGVAAP